MRSNVQTGFVGSQLTNLGKEIGRGQKLSWPRKRTKQREKAERLAREAAGLGISVQALLARKAKDVPRVLANAAARVAYENRLRQEGEGW